MKKLSSNKCTGCGACASSCPKSCIELKANKEGFLYPKIDNNQCINCNICVKTCPIYKKTNKTINKVKSFAFFAKKDSIRLGSSSGGFFPLIAEYIIGSKGIVYGASYSSDFKSVQHIRVSDLSSLNKLYGSKYVQSSISKDIYKSVLVDLKKDKLVLFAGTSCQIEGLKAYLNKDYFNLYCVEIVCHGVPSPLLFKKYIESISGHSKDNLQSLNFRDKMSGWRNYCTSYTKADSKPEYIRKINSTYMGYFLKDYCLRESCYNCKFKGLNRNFDFLIGDFWGIDNIAPDLNDDKGVSIIFVNSNKANSLFEIIKKDANYKQISLSDGVINNLSILKSVKRPKQRNYFYSNINEGFASIDKNFNSVPSNLKIFDVGIITFYDLTNVGNRLQNYAINFLINKKGLNPVNFVINKYTLSYKIKDYIRYLIHKFTRYSLTTDKDLWRCLYKRKKIFNKFNEKYLNIKNAGNLRMLKHKAKCFVAGSDQIWNPFFYNSAMKDIFFLDFADKNQRIALSPSIGVSDFPIKFAKYYKSHLLNFDKLSIREKSGKEIIKSISGQDAKVLIDPTLALSKEDWLKISKKSRIIKTKKPYILCLFLDDKISKAKEDIEFINKNNQFKIINLCSKDEPSSYYFGPSEFIHFINNADIVLTDSYHATIFSFIFNKPFIVYNRNNNIGSHPMETRIESLLTNLNLLRKYKAHKQFSKNYFEHDYSKSYCILEKLKIDFNCYLNDELIEKCGFTHSNKNPK